MHENSFSQVFFICPIPIKINLCFILKEMLLVAFSLGGGELKRTLCSIIERFYDLVLNAKVE